MTCHDESREAGKNVHTPEMSRFGPHKRPETWQEPTDLDWDNTFLLPYNENKVQYRKFMLQHTDSYTLFPIENLFCMKKIIRRTVWLEKMKVNLVVFSLWFIFQLINETDTWTF